MATTGLQIEAPRTPRRQRAANRTNFEMYAWVFMRLSGLLLVVLVFTHLFVNAFIDGGVQRISFAFVAGKYASPFWQVFDLADRAMGAWEPSFDTELWRQSGQLNLYLQTVHQADAEGVLPTGPTKVGVLEWTPTCPPAS